MTYAEMLDKQQKEFDVFSEGKIFFAIVSNRKEFDKILKKEGVIRKEISPIGFGGYIKKQYIDQMRELVNKHKREKQEAVQADKDGTGFIKSMFFYELCNHEYAYTYDTAETLECLGLTVDDINNNPALKNGLDLAIKGIVGDNE